MYGACSVYHHSLASSLPAHSVMGRGVGRHLLGLQCILSDEWAWLGNIAGASSGIGQGTNTITPGMATSHPVPAFRSECPPT